MKTKNFGDIPAGCVFLMYRRYGGFDSYAAHRKLNATHALDLTREHAPDFCNKTDIWQPLEDTECRVDLKQLEYYSIHNHAPPDLTLEQIYSWYPSRAETTNDADPTTRSVL